MDRQHSNMATNQFDELPKTPPHAVHPGTQLLTPPLTGESGAFPKRFQFTEGDSQDSFLEQYPSEQSSTDPSPTEGSSSDDSSDHGDIERLKAASGRARGWKPYYFVSDSDEERELRYSVEKRYTNYKEFVKREPRKAVADSTSESVSSTQPTTSLPDSAPNQMYDRPDALISKAASSLSNVTLDFMGLPLEVRKKIYVLTLTVPALVSVRQIRTTQYKKHDCYIYTNPWELAPGIAFVLCQTEVDGFKTRFHSNTFVNAAILRINKTIHAEAKAVMYGINYFDLANHNKETSPRVNFSVPLFPKSYPRLIRNVVIRASSIYGFQYMIKDGGHVELKNLYCGLEKLLLIVELDSAGKGYGRKLAREPGEKWAPYVKRVHNILQLELFDCEGICKSIPIWVDMRAMFPGESYVDEMRVGEVAAMDDDLDENQVSEQYTKRAVAEAFELFKKGGRQ
jgi:hypothetical protein